MPSDRSSTAPFTALALAACVLAIACARDNAATEPTTPPTAPELAADAPPEPPRVTAIETREVSYSTPTTNMKGMVAYPSAAEGKRPAVLVIHEWWGLTDYARERAAQLAELGYVAMAVDMFGDGKQAAHPEDAQKFMMEVMGNLEEGVRRFEAARAVLAGDPRVDAEKIATIGYCMGGAIALHMARLGADLDVVASFHGNLATQTPMKPGAFTGKILIAHGGSDPFVPQEQLAAFEQEMQAAGASHEVAVYPNAKHGFTNPKATEIGEKFGTPHAYDAQADEDSWKRLERLLAQVWSE